MSIFLTGASGFVGTNLIKRLLKEGHEVFSFDKILNPFGRTDFL